MTNYFEMGSLLRQRARDEKVRNVLAEAFQPAQQPVAVDNGLAPQPITTGAPAGVNWPGAFEKLYSQGLGPEALSLEEKVYGPARDRQKLQLQYQLKRALETGRMEDAQRIFGELSGGSASGSPGITMSIGPQGPTIAFDPAKAAQDRRENAKGAWEGWLRPQAEPGGQASPAGGGLSPRARAELAADRAKKQPEDLAQIQNITADLNLLQDTAGKLRTHPGLNTSTGWLAGFGSIPAPTDAYGFSSELDAFKNQMVINTMAKLKALSASGATGFGNLTEKEGGRMENLVASLNRARKTEDVVKSLQDIEDFMEGVKSRSAQDYRQTYGVDAANLPTRRPQAAPGGQGRARSAYVKPRVGEVRNGFMYVGGDDAAPTSWKAVGK